MLTAIADIAITAICGTGIMFAGIMIANEYRDRKFVNTGEAVLFKLIVYAIVVACIVGIRYAGTL